MSNGMSKIQDLAQSTFFCIFLNHLILNLNRAENHSFTSMIEIKTFQFLVIIGVKDKRMFNHFRESSYELSLIQCFQKINIDKYRLQLGKSSYNVLYGIHVYPRFSAYRRLYLR